jgi:hypothetical protein
VLEKIKERQKKFKKGLDRADIVRDASMKDVATPAPHIGK